MSAESRSRNPWAPKAPKITPTPHNTAPVANHPATRGLYDTVVVLDWVAFSEFINGRLQELVNTDFEQVRYADTGTAILIAIIVATATLLTFARLALLRRRHARHHSVHEVASRHRQGRVIWLLYNLPKAFLALAVIVILVALSDPFVTSTEEVSGNVESRVRIDLVDTSLSMAWEFANSERSRAEIAREAHLQFLAMRR